MKRSQVFRAQQFRQQVVGINLLDVLDSNREIKVQTPFEPFTDEVRTTRHVAQRMGLLREIICILSSGAVFSNCSRSSFDGRYFAGGLILTSCFDSGTLGADTFMMSR